MTGRRLRVALAAALTAPLLVAPVAALGVSAPLSCPGVTRLGPWQKVPVEEFRGVQGVSTRDVVTGYAVDEQRPQRVLATNGNTVKLSGSYGCAWDDVLVLEAEPRDGLGVSGVSSTVVATALLPNGPALAAVREGSGAASRPHVAVSDSGRRGSWRLSDQGLPPQGAPRLLHPAHDGRTAYLVVDPVNDGGSAGGTLPGLPEVPGTAPLGGLYATDDGGRTWSLRSDAAALPGAITALAVDVREPDLVYAVADGRLLISRDGGRDFRDGGLALVQTVETMEADEVAVAINEQPPTEDGILMHSTDAGATFDGRGSILDLRSLSYRRGDGVLVGEARGRLFRIDARRDGRPQRLQAPGPATPGSTQADRSDAASFTALSEHALLRWVDPETGTGVAPPPVVGDLAPPPPPKGRVAPPSRSVRIPVGETATLDYTLVLPPSPTPLDLVFLVDTSPSMSDYIADVRANLVRITQTLAASGLDVKVGLATIGAGPDDGQPSYPEANPADPGYRKPEMYRLLRAVGDVDAQLLQALGQLRTQNVPQTAVHPQVLEGQLVALRQLVEGDGVREPGSPDAAPRYRVAPRQQAGFRDQLGIRRLVIHATDEPFNNPAGTPRKRNGSPDLDGVAQLLAAERVQQAGIVPVVGGKSRQDLRRMATLTRALVPPGQRLDCTDNVFLDPGDPLVCEAPAGFSGVITELVRALADEQDAAVVPVGSSPVLGSVSAPALRGLDVTRRNDVPFQVRVSCVDVAPGTYEQAYDAVLRGFTVASVTTRVTCTPAAVAAVVPPKPAAVAPDAPAPNQPVAQAPAAPAPAPPVVQPQAQPQAQAQTQVQAQVNPMTAAMLQQQEELQLALALLADEKPSAGGQLAMVDRRRGEQLRALALLSVSALAASGLGLARLRTRTSGHVRVRRVR